MWISGYREDSMDQIFNDLIHECKYVAPGAQLTYSLRNRLEKYKKVRTEIVSRTKDGCAPLFIACKRGNVEIVDYLITVCGANVEQRGKYEVPDERSVHCVTPLWCAAVSGKLPVMKCLISHGAEINAVSDSGSTPVRSACFMTHLDIVSYLVEHGADILKANYNGGTCLINSVQSVELCTYLLQHGADVNATDIQNKTALHYAIQEHRLETTKLLLEHNANPHLKSRYNDDALQTACLKGAIHIFEYLVDTVAYSPEKLADANELMGSTFLDEHNDTHTALRYWRRAMAIRIANSVDGAPLPKRPVLPKCEAYRNAREFATLEELNAVALDLDAIRIQSLLICERVLGPHHKDTLFHLMFRGATYADALRYQNCIDLWRRALEIRVEKDSILYTDTCFAAQVLLRLMVDLNEKTLEVVDRNQDTQEPKFRDVVAIFKLLSGQLTEARELLEKRPVHKRQKDCYERILKCVTHLIYLLVETARSEDEKDLMHQLVRDLVKKNPRSVYTGDTLLHLCVSSLNTVNSNYFNPADDIHTIFPRLDVAKLLLECGAYVDAKNILRSTPLHIASRGCNFDNHLVKLLLDYGAHLDTPNRAGDTPARLLSCNPLNTVNLVSYISLQCHAAQAIYKYGIRGTDLPVTLHHFLELHKE
ncbi:PREDICTED: protein fem-1 homolog A [Dinoponera quadriceps]|uniref:Protein fem-1 homolog A n=1 Tax=Dinoponera quadriceps TaxID=609295 RepID=A0A6P3Y763_DINQU|nr:PREDICTED: protein fem-1 homolog A [Dinoponera quadriceps]XP_014486870.1 PREDICTED: protein fem-1 homolog A [Dinoponera quadriceps]XP_014486871.1 PREDICTED: protein fem-1 homolog A [Dinoponera quadriceps]XP_014486872.1 PREDICTED: protein fem-1 homolog A [Dinoponera quadriceps]XP_014486873.1 PREDICTED: protein fem-1 homolog A [Dinoponera quadriceps]XP_014486874.1 PREDICTED: protein fem-1 homolog A [Dinoponera quadriceps]XP_014486875.1 PREDICTED: protein fem-1 homolog A [Dinoponera quadricep